MLTTQEKTGFALMIVVLCLIWGGLILYTPEPLEKVQPPEAPAATVTTKSKTASKPVPASVTSTASIKSDAVVKILDFTSFVWKVRDNRNLQSVSGFPSLSDKKIGTVTVWMPHEGDKFWISDMLLIQSCRIMTFVTFTQPGKICVLPEGYMQYKAFKSNKQTRIAGMNFPNGYEVSVTCPSSMGYNRECAKLAAIASGYAINRKGKVVKHWPPSPQPKLTQDHDRYRVMKNVPKWKCEVTHSKDRTVKYRIVETR